MSGPIFQQGCANGDNGPAIFPISFPGPSTPGNCIVVLISFQAAAPNISAISLTDNNGNTWFPLPFILSGTQSSQAFIATNIQTPNSPTIILTPSKSGGGAVTRWSLTAVEYSGVSLDRGFITVAGTVNTNITVNNQPGGPNITLLALDTFTPSPPNGVISGPPTWTKRVGISFTLNTVPTAIFESAAFAGGTATFQDTHGSKVYIVVLNPGEAHAVDAYVVREPDHFLDAYLALDQLKSHFVDSDIQADQSESHFIDSDIKADQSEFHFIDSDIQIDQSKIHNIDAYIQVDQSRIHNIDCDVQVDQSRIHFIDADIQADQSKFHFIDVDVQVDSSKIHNIDVDIQTSSSDIHNIDAYIQGLGSDTHNIDAYIQIDQSKSHSVDCFLFSTAVDRSISHSIDCDVLTFVDIIGGVLVVNTLLGGQIPINSTIGGILEVE